MYVRFEFTHIEINARTQGIKSIMASQVWPQAVAGARFACNSQPITISIRPPRHVRTYEGRLISPWPKAEVHELHVFH